MGGETERRKGIDRETETDSDRVVQSQKACLQRASSTVRHRTWNAATSSAEEAAADFFKSRSMASISSFTYRDSTVQSSALRSVQCKGLCDCQLIRTVQSQYAAVQMHNDRSVKDSAAECSAMQCNEAQQSTVQWTVSSLHLLSTRGTHKRCLASSSIAQYGAVRYLKSSRFEGCPHYVRLGVETRQTHNEATSIITPAHRGVSIRGHMGNIETSW